MKNILITLILKAKSLKLKATDGFTLVEILTVLGILVVISGISVWGFSGLANIKTLDLAAEELVANLRDAQRRAITQENSSQWGVRINALSENTDFYEMFSGAAYSGGTITSKTTL